MVNDKINNKGIEMEEVLVLNENELGRLMKTVVNEFDFPEYIVQVKGPFPIEKRFKYDNYRGAESYYNNLYFN